MLYLTDLTDLSDLTYRSYFRISKQFLSYDERSTDALIEMLDDEYNYVQVSACRGLADIGDREPIRKLLNDEDEYVRSVAKEALKSFKVEE